MLLALVVFGWTALVMVASAWAGYRIGYEDATREARQYANRITRLIEELDAEDGAK